MVHKGDLHELVNGINAPCSPRWPRAATSSATSWAARGPTTVRPCCARCWPRSSPASARRRRRTGSCGSTASAAVTAEPALHRRAAPQPSRCTATCTCRASSRSAWPGRATTASTCSPTTSASCRPCRTGDVADGDGPVVTGYMVFVGGGMGMAWAREDDTYPRLGIAARLGRPPDRVVDTVEAIVTTQRDYGNREDRNRARLKYLVDERGTEWLRAEVERRLGAPIGDPVEIAPWTVDHHHGTRDGVVGVPVPSGRVRDHDGVQLRTALRELVGDGTVTELRVTPRQDLLLHGIAAGAGGRGRAAPARPRRRARRRRERAAPPGHRLPGAADVRPGARRGRAGAAGAGRRAREGAVRRRRRRRADPAQHDRLPERVRPALQRRDRHRRAHARRPTTSTSAARPYGDRLGAAHPQPTCRSTSSPRPWPRVRALRRERQAPAATVATPARFGAWAHEVGAATIETWLPDAGRAAAGRRGTR